MRSTINSEQSYASQFLDATDGVEFTHIHHSPSLPGSSSGPPSTAPSVLPSPPVSTQHTDSSPTADPTIIPKTAPKTAPVLHRYTHDVDNVSVYTIPSEDMALAVSRYRESVEGQDGKRRDTAATSRTLSNMHSAAGFISRTNSNADAIARVAERIEHTFAIACAATDPVSEPDNSSVMMFPSQRSSDDIPEAGESAVMHKRDGDASTNDLACFRVPGVLRSTGNGETEELDNRRYQLGATTVAGAQTAVLEGGRDITMARLEMEAGVEGRESDVSPVAAEPSAADRQSHDVACVHADHACMLRLSCEEGGSFKGAAELQQQALAMTPRKGWGESTTGAAARGGLPSAAAGISLRGRSTEVEEILRSKRRHPGEIHAGCGSTVASSAIESAIDLPPQRTEDISPGRSGELLDSQVCNC